MAPVSPHGNSRTLRSPAAGSPVPLTGIPPPASSVLQRRSLGPPPSAQSAHTAKNFQNMSSPEQQSLLQEAISIHSPGLLDTARARGDSVGSSSGTAAYPSPLPTSFAPGIPASNRTHSPTTFASPLSYRASQTMTPTPRRPSASGATTPHSAISPLTTSFLQQSHSSSASSSPVTADSPSTSRLSRLSLGANAVSNPASASNTRLMMKQPLFHRPPSADGGASGTPTSVNSAGTLPTIPASAAPSQAESHGQTQLPPSLEGIELGDRVVVESMGLTGYLRFVGTAAFKTGIWAGIELDTPTGKNDGSVAGVAYFNCRPNCGIFVLAAKIVKAELLIPFSSAPDGNDVQATVTTSAGRPPSLQEDRYSTPPPANNAAQAASRITAGSRASKYIGVTASQLKQRHTMPQPANSRPLAQQQQQTQQLSQQHQTTTSDTVLGSPTSARTLANGSSRVKTTSPTPVTHTGRAGLGSRLSQPGSKTSLLSMTNKPGTTLSRSGSTTTSPPSSITNRPRTSPTPGRLMSSPRRLSSRASDTSDNGGSNSYSNNNNGNSDNISTSSSPKNLLDQATLIQMAESPKGDLAVQLQQLQLDFGVAVAENNMLKTEMNQTKSQLEMTRLLEKRDLSYDERVFLSKSLGRGGIDERLSQELEELHSMKEAWEKEKSAKDLEIKGITDKMTEAWLEAARSQKERTALLQEKEELEERLKELQESGGSGGVRSGSSADQDPSINDEERQEQHQLAIDSLTKDLHAAEERIAALELKLQQYESQAAEDDAALQEREEALTETRVHYAEQLTLLEQERDDLQERLDDLELVLKVTTESLQSKLEAALRDTAHSEEQLHEVQARLDHEAEVRRTKESEAEIGHRQMEADLQQSQSLLAKTEKMAKEFESKAKEYESTITKREQEIASLKLELEDLTGMVQSEEVDRMRKVWENEKKRLEDEVAESKVAITDLRQEIQHLKANEEDLLGQIADLSSAIAAWCETRSEMETEMARLQKSSEEAQEQFAKERSDWQGKVTECEMALEVHAAETKIKMESLEAIASSAETWKEQYEALQLEINQKTANAEDAGVEIAEAIAQRDASKLEASAVRKKLEDTISRLAVSHQEDLEKVQRAQKAAEDEKLGLLTKVSELEAALALSASVSAKTTAAESDAAESANQNRSDLEEEIVQLKKMVHDLTRENVTVANVNKKLMQEHDNLMEAHKHVETECLKLMDEVERLHAESLTAASMDGESEGAEEKDDEPTESMENIEPKSAATAFKETMPESHGPTQAPPSQPQSVIRLEGLLKEKQALLDRLTQAHASEMRELRQRYIDLDRSKAYEVGQLNKELTELESLIESKIFHEADLEEEVQRKQKEIDWLRHEISDLKNQPSRAAGSTLAPTSRMGSTNNSRRGNYPSSASSATVPGAQNHKAEPALFCEICEVEGHDIVTCAAVFGANNNNKSGLKMSASRSSLISTPVPSEMEDERPYCENCEEFGLHYTEECPNESLTY